MKQNFVDLKIQNGWKVNIIETNESATIIGRDSRKTARHKLEQTRTESICAAAQINSEMPRELAKLPVLVLKEQAELDRYWLEEFYGEQVSATLIDLDNNGAYRRKIKLLAAYLFTCGNAKKRGLTETFIPTVDPSNELAAPTLLRELFSSAGLVDACGYFLREKTVSNADLQAFKNLCLQRKNSVESLLKISVRADIATKPVTQLGELLREVACGWNKAMKKDVHGQRVNYYTVNYEGYERAKKYAESVNKRKPFPR